MTIEEVFGDLVVFGFSIFDLGDAALRKEEDARVRIGQQDWRVGSDDKL